MQHLLTRARGCTAAGNSGSGGRGAAGPAPPAGFQFRAPARARMYRPPNSSSSARPAGSRSTVHANHGLSTVAVPPPPPSPPLAPLQCKYTPASEHTFACQPRAGSLASSWELKAGERAVACAESFGGRRNSLRPAARLIFILFDPHVSISGRIAPHQRMRRNGRAVTQDARPSRAQVGGLAALDELASSSLCTDEPRCPGDHRSAARSEPGSAAAGARERPFLPGCRYSPLAPRPPLNPVALSPIGPVRAINTFWRLPPNGRAIFAARRHLRAAR